MAMSFEELRARAAELERIPSTLTPPHWQYWRMTMWDHLNNNDPNKFYEWPCIYHCMLVNHWKDVIAKEVNDLPPMYLRLAQMPFLSTQDYYNHSEYSLNLIHQLYHFWQWEQFTGKKVSQLNTIIEIGAGYGAMALVARRLGFQGDYYIYDLPEFCLLQEYFLSNIIPHSWGVQYQWNAILPKTADLLIACYSLSEMPIRDREHYLNAVDSQSYLFLFSQKWVDYDNLHYFRAFAELTTRPGTWHWQIKQSRYLPEGNWYALGNRIDEQI